MILLKSLQAITAMYHGSVTKTMSATPYKLRLLSLLCLLSVLSVFCFARVQAETSVAVAQKKRRVKTQKPKQQPPTELDKLRDEYIKTTKELKASLEKLLALYEGSQSKAEARYAQRS